MIEIVKDKIVSIHIKPLRIDLGFVYKPATKGKWFTSDTIEGFERNNSLMGFYSIKTLEDAGYFIKNMNVFYPASIIIKMVDGSEFYKKFATTQEANDYRQSLEPLPDVIIFKDDHEEGFDNQTTI